MSEESRAEAYRASLEAQKVYRQAQYASLEGDPAALAELTENWQPLIDAIREAKSYGYPEQPRYETCKPGYLCGWQPLQD